LTLDEAVELIGSERAVTLVGEADGRIIGMVLTTASAPIAWIHRLAVVTDGADELEVADQLLERAEAEFADRGVRRVASAGASVGGAGQWLEHRGLRGTARYRICRAPATSCAGRATGARAPGRASHRAGSLG
jgi:hypothetical protein